jgi:CTD small phosphatase-like protein 2
LTKLGRDLSKVIIIDNIADNFRFQPNNGLHIKTWNNDMKDTQLSDLKTILRDIYLFGIADVRDIIKSINEDVGKMKIKSYAKIDITKYMKS